MWSCDQSLVTVVFLWEKLSWPQLYKDFTRKTAFFDGWSWFKFNNSGLALGTNLTFFTSVATGLKLKVTKFWRLNPTFVEVTGEKLVGGTLFIPPPSWALNSFRSIFTIKILMIIMAIIKMIIILIIIMIIIMMIIMIIKNSLLISHEVHSLFSRINASN